jgi:phage terminase small subunit
MDAPRLTPTQRRFVAARKAGATLREAAIKAGLSEKTARSAGTRLIKHPAVIAAMAGQKVARAPRKAQATRTAKVATPPAPPATDAAPPAEPPATVYEDPKDYLRFVMNDPAANPRLRNDAAKALLAVENKKPAEVGKKAARNEAAKSVAGRFAAGAPPKLVAAGGRKV